MEPGNDSFGRVSGYPYMPAQPYTVPLCETLYPPLSPSFSCHQTRDKYPHTCTSLTSSAAACMSKDRQKHYIILPETVLLL